MFCSYALEVCSFLMRNRKEVDLDINGGRKYLGGVERGDLYSAYSVQKMLLIKDKKEYQQQIRKIKK